MGKKKEKKEKKGLIFTQKNDVVIQGSVQPAIPSNLAGVVQDTGKNILMTLDFLNPLRGGRQWHDLLTGKGMPKDIYDRFMKRVKFEKEGRTAGVSIKMDISAMERENGKIDFAFRVNNTYQTTYKKSLGGHHPMRSLFQDMVRFRIWPKDSSSGITINPDASLPETQMETVNYSNSASWDTKVGFNVDGKVEDKKLGVEAGVSGELSRSFSISASRNAKDFNMIQSSDIATQTLKWSSGMKNMNQAGGNQAVATGYDHHNPGKIVNKGLFETHLHDPPEAAIGDLRLGYLAAYTVPAGDKKNNVFKFEFSTTQRLMHAEVAGRWGLPGAEVGGIPAVIPYLIFTKGEIVFDLSKNHIEAKKISCEGTNC